MYVENGENDKFTIFANLTAIAIRIWNNKIETKIK